MFLFTVCFSFSKFNFVAKIGIYENKFIIYVPGLQFLATIYNSIDSSRQQLTHMAKSKADTTAGTFGLRMNDILK